MELAESSDLVVVCVDCVVVVLELEVSGVWEVLDGDVLEGDVLWVELGEELDG
jgi:hypothetical protein